MENACHVMTTMTMTTTTESILSLAKDDADAQPPAKKQKVNTDSRQQWGTDCMGGLGHQFQFHCH